jgi:hypothetical protein
MSSIGYYRRSKFLFQDFCEPSNAGRLRVDFSTLGLV